MHHSIEQPTDRSTEERGQKDANPAFRAQPFNKAAGTAHGLLVVLRVERCPWRAPKLTRCGRAGPPFRVAEAPEHEVVHGNPSRYRLSHDLDISWLSPLTEGGKGRNGRERQVWDVLLKQDPTSGGYVHELHHELFLLALVEQLVHDIAALEGIAAQLRRSQQQAQHRAGAALREPVVNHQSRLGLRRRAPDRLVWRARGRD